MAPAQPSSPSPLPTDILPPGGSRWWWIPIAVLAVVVLEVTSRIEDRITYGMPFFSRITTSSDLVLRDTLGARGRPNTVFRRWRLDSLGFRGPEITPLPAPGVTRIVTSGASETFGLYESAGHEYPRQLEDSLRARMVAACGAAPGRGVEVVNVALPGMALPSLSRHLHQVVGPLRPSVVVLYPSPGFYLNPRAPQAAEAVRADTSLPASKAGELRILDRVVSQLKNLAPAPVMTWSRRRATRFTLARNPTGWRFREVPADRLQQFDDDLRVAVGAVRSIGAIPVLVGHVNATMAPGFDDPDLLVAWEYQFPRAEPQVLPAFHEQAVARMARIAGDSAALFVDLRRALDGRWEGSFADFVHFTDAGSATVAGALAAALGSPGGPVTCPESPPRPAPR